MKSTSSKREAPKNSNKVQKKVIKNKDQPPGKKVGKKKKSKIKDKENQRTREKQTKRKKSNSKNTPARLEQSTKILSCEKSPKSIVKSSKSNVSPKSTIYSSIVNSSTVISSEGVLESPQKKVSPELSSTLKKKRNKVKLFKRLSRMRLSRIWKSKLIEEKIREELENGKNIASIVEFINTTVDVEPKISYRKKPLKANHEICKKHLKEPHKRKTITLSEEAHARRDIGKEQKILKHKDHKKTLKHNKEEKETLKHKDHKKTLKHNKEEKENLKHKDHKKILKHFASKSKNNDAISNNTHDNCNIDAKEDLKFMSCILKTFNIPRNICEKGLEKHMLHFLYEHYRTFLKKYMMIAKFRNSDYFHYFQNEDVEKAIEKLNEETESAFPPLIEELLSKTIQENSSVEHAFCRSSESNNADELKVLDTENTISNKDNTTGLDESNHSVMNNSNTQLLIHNFYENYVRTLNENRYFINGITNSQFVPKCQHEQKNINEFTEKESSITSDTYPQYFVPNDQHQQNNINELTEKESSITCNTDPQYSMHNHYHEQKTIGLDESSVPVTNKQNLQYSMLSYLYGENGTSKLDANVTNDNYLQNIVPKYGPIEKDTSKLNENAHFLTNDTNPPKIEAQYEDIESEDENVDGDPSPKNISFQDNPTERNMSREDENVSMAGDSLPEPFSYLDNLAESNMPREDENVSVAGDALPSTVLVQDNLAESNMPREDENVSVAGDALPSTVLVQDNLAESNMPSEDENVSVAGDALPSTVLVQDNLAESNMPREYENVSVAGDFLPSTVLVQDNLVESISDSEDENVSVVGDKFLDSLVESNSSSEDENDSVAGDISPKYFSLPSEWKSYENTCYSTKEVISERLDHLRASMFYNIF